MSLRKLTVALLVVCFAFSATAFAEWQAMTSDVPAGLQMKVLKSTPNLTKLELTLPGYQVGYVKHPTGEKPFCIQFIIPDASWHMKAECPNLPRVSELVQIANSGDAQLEVISTEEVEIDLPGWVIPSKGHLTRDINPATVPYKFGPVYDTNNFYVEDGTQFSIGEEFIMRDVRGVRLSVMPITVNHVTMKMRVIKKAVVAIKTEGVGANNTLSVARVPSKNFSSLYNGAFLNYQAPAGINNSVPAEDNKVLEVIVYDAFAGLQSYTDWKATKEAKGFKVTEKIVNDSTSAQDIKNYLAQRFQAERFGYVVIVGDIGQVPTLQGPYESADSDSMLVRLEGNDNYQDAFISRISGNNAKELDVQFDKIIRYEKSAKPGPWNTGVLGIASDEGYPHSDEDRMNWILRGGSKGQKQPVEKNGLMGMGYNKDYKEYGYSASKSGVANALNNGVNVICYIGHGSATSWVTSGFNNSDIKNLRNSEMLPVIWSVACVNGEFDRRECFAEAWLRQPNGGAVAVEAASTNEAWVPPCDKQAATINAYINRSHRTFGALEMAGRLAALKLWGDGNRDQGTQLADQCNLFGDCTMIVRYPQQDRSEADMIKDKVQKDIEEKMNK
jgi:gingipain R